MYNPRAEASKKRKAEFLELLGSGLTLQAARESMRPVLPKNTYHGWRKDDAEFRRLCDDIVNADRYDEATGVDDGTFAGFRKHYFGFDTYWHHAEISRAMDTAGPMGVTLVTLPPEHGKTTTIADKISERIARNANSRITYISEGQGLARKAIGRQQRRMTDVKNNSLFIGKWGPFTDEGRTGKPWTADYFTVLKADHDEQDYTMEARGWTGSIAGTRTDQLVIDDLQSRRSLARTSDMMATFQQDFLTRPGKEGSTVIIGTRVEVGDVYEQMIDSGLLDKHVVLAAVDETQVVDCPLGGDCNVDMPHLKPLCPEMWDAHSLAKKRLQVGEAAWQRNYQQKPIALGEQTFTEGMKDRSTNLMRPLGLTEVVGSYRVMALDPALGGGNALTCWGMDGDRIWLIDVQRDFQLSRTEQILGRIERFAMLYRPRVLIVETNAFQKGLGNDERLRELGRRFGFRIQPHTTQNNKIDDLIGVASMDTTFMQGGFDFPYGDELAQAKTDAIWEELLRWRPTVPTKKLRQDLVMSTWFAWLHWMEMKATLAGKSDARSFQREALAGATPLSSYFGGRR